MNFLEYLLSGVSIGITFSLIPSPLLALLINETLRYGKKEGIMIAITPPLSDIPVSIIALLIMYQLSSVNVLFGIISISGAVFLGYLGIKGLRSHGIKTNPAKVKPQSLRKGIITNFLNPNPYIFWLTVGAPTVIKGWQQHYALPILFLSGFFFCLVVPRVIAACVISRFRNIVSGRGYIIVSKILSLVLVAFAVKLLVQGIRLAMNN